MKNFTKKLISAVAAAVLCFSTGFCAEEDRLFYEYKFYTATVYLLNPDGGGVILQNVRKKNSYGTEELAPELEYNEFKIIPDNIYSADGEKLSFSQVNSYLLDSKVSVLAAKNKTGIKIIYMKFLK